METAVGRIGLTLIVGPLRALPLPVVRLVGRTLGRVAYRLMGRYRRVALKNLALVYGDTESPAVRRHMAQAVFRHFGEMGAEFVKMPLLSRARIDRLVTVYGEENLRAAYEPGKGVLLVTGHFGNWEFMARWLSTHGYRLNVIARKANDPMTNRWMTRTRESGGAQVFTRGNSARAALQSLKRNEIVAILADQNAGDVFVPFLGKRTGTVDGPAVIHLKTGSPLLFSWCTRTNDNRFEITFEPPEVVAGTGDRAEDVRSVMSMVNARLEAQIRKRPTQWLWLHDRWKGSPGVFTVGSADQPVEGQQT